MASSDTTKMSGVDDNSNSLDDSVPDSKTSVDFRIDHSWQMEVDANVNDHTFCIINHESRWKSIRQIQLCCK